MNKSDISDIRHLYYLQLILGPLRTNISNQDIINQEIDTIMVNSFIISFKSRFS